MDDPKRDDRRIHTEPLPRWGGLGIYIGIVIAVAVGLIYSSRLGLPAPPYIWSVIPIAGALAVFGVFDDLYQFSAKIQALILLGAGLVVQFVGSATDRVQIQTVGEPFQKLTHVISLGVLAVPVTAFYILVVTKTMDTIDGVDGLSVGIAAISSTTLTVISLYSGQPHLAILAAAVGGASLGFLRHNYNPAKIIMGTSGPYVLGFLLACISIIGALKIAAAVSVAVPLLVFGVPIFDAFFVVCRRLLSGQPITQADKRHLHHTLLKSGLNQRQTVWVLYGASALLCIIAVLMFLFQYGRV